MRKRTPLLLVALLVAVVISSWGASATTIQCYQPADQNGTYDPDNKFERNHHIDIDVLPGPYMAASSSGSPAAVWKICIEENPDE